ncbi:hypothetical protein JOC75_001125 [Metabacillus crassostreae]|uniref:hypothetical protein n=1 Tax=Metabacillus crassostreae TaxID=929098 RepID=UPI00195A6F14|nr:hypothetical protein [Metabacillus crassostreae]MBM7603155.1 hypothetical protein [Metabacillus crassostreae]
MNISLRTKLFSPGRLTSALFGDGSESSEIGQKLNQYIGLQPEVQAIYVVTTDGRMITSPKLELPDDYDSRGRPCTKKQIKKREK